MSDGIPSPNPTYKQDIHNVSGNVEEIIQTSNLFDKTKAEYGEINFTNGGVIADNNYYHSDYIEVKENTPHRLNINTFNSSAYGQAYYDKNKNFISGEASTNSFTTPANAKYLRFCFRNENWTSGTASITDINTVMLVEGTNMPSNYIPHQQQTLPFTLSQGQKMYKGSYLADDGIHHVRGEVVFDGSDDENWRIITYNRCSVDVVNFKAPGNNAVADILCNRLLKTSKNSIASATNAISGGEAGASTIMIRIDDTITTVLELKALLVEKPLTVEYPLAEEVIDPYTETQQAQYNAIKKAISYKGQTNITLTSSDAAPLTNVVAVADMSNALNIINARLDLLEE